MVSIDNVIVSENIRRDAVQAKSRVQVVISVDVCKKDSRKKKDEETPRRKNKSVITGHFIDLTI
jgi:hypothetical protein